MSDFTKMGKHPWCGLKVWAVDLSAIVDGLDPLQLACRHSAGAIARTSVRFILCVNENVALDAQGERHERSPT